MLFYNSDKNISIRDVCKTTSEYAAVVITNFQRLFRHRIYVYGISIYPLGSDFELFVNFWYHRSLKKDYWGFKNKKLDTSRVLYLIVTSYV